MIARKSRLIRLVTLPEQVSQQEVSSALSREGVLLQLRTHHTTQQQHTVLLQQYLDEASRDWESGSKAFWRKVLNLLATLRGTTQTWRDWMEAEMAHTVLGAFIPIRHQSLLLLNRVDTLVNNAGIEVTAYLANGTSRTVKHLYQRQNVLRTLQDLVATLQRLNGQTASHLQTLAAEPVPQLPAAAQSHDQEGCEEDEVQHTFPQEITLGAHHLVLNSDQSIELMHAEQGQAELEHVLCLDATESYRLMQCLNELFQQTTSG